MRRIVELPCDIGDNIYEIIVDKIGKEVCFDCYVVQDVSIKTIKYCDEWKDRCELGTSIFLDQEIAEQIFKKMKMSDEYKNYLFYKYYKNK